MLHCFIKINIKLNYLKYESFIRKKNQDCLFSLKTITEEFDFVIFGETSLNVHNMSSNHLLVHRLLCCIFMISFFFLAVYVLINLGFFYFLNHNICKIIISSFAGISYIFTLVLFWKLSVFILFLFHLKNYVKYLSISKCNYICKVFKVFWNFPVRPS